MDPGARTSPLAREGNRGGARAVARSRHSACAASVTAQGQAMPVFGFVGDPYSGVPIGYSPYFEAGSIGKSFHVPLSEPVLPPVSRAFGGQATAGTGYANERNSVHVLREQYASSYGNAEPLAYVRMLKAE